jgi:protein-L-isoaspartate(D-aspartate) O-methyltransferase
MRRLAPPLACLAALLAAVLAPGPASANPFGCARIAGTVLARAVKPEESRAFAGAALAPPIADRAAFIAYMGRTRGDDPELAGLRFDRVRAMIAQREIWREKEVRALLVTAREEFVRTTDREAIYAPRFQPIGCGVTITDPPLVGRMTAELDVKPGDKVLEIGTGSGYQAAILAALTDKVFTIEIIPPIGRAADAIYAGLAATSAAEYARIRRKIADGYYGWEDEAPFDKIIVTAGIDHVPPPLLRQLKVGGVMLIPIGTPGKQAVLKIIKHVTPAGQVVIQREDIYAEHPTRRGGGPFTTFVPFTKVQGERIVPRFGKPTAEPQ